jgi:ribosome maturation factor RimP
LSAGIGSSFNQLIASGPAAAIADLLRPAAETLSLEIVRVSFAGSSGVNLQIMLEHPDGTAPTVEDCTNFSRATSAILDEKNPVAGEYTLEVSSPGIDRPLTRAKDFERWAGFQTRIETHEMLDGQKRFNGELAGFDGEAVTMRLDTKTVSIPVAAILRARLILNDHLLAAAKAA